MASLRRTVQKFPRQLFLRRAAQLARCRQRRRRPRDEAHVTYGMRYVVCLPFCRLKKTTAASATTFTPAFMVCRRTPRSLSRERLCRHADAAYADRFDRGAKSAAEARDPRGSKESVTENAENEAAEVAFGSLCVV
jgi:hypothetical protein